MRVAAIVNPAAGSGRSVRRWRRLERALSTAGIEARCFISEGPGAAVELARQALAAGFDTIVAVGGDGTVHEVVNGIGVEGMAHATLGVLPSGTGMDFARNLKLPRSIKAFIDSLRLERKTRMDVGVCLLGEEQEANLFVNFAETGLGADVVARESRYSDAWPGRVSFFLAALAAASSAPNSQARIGVDGQIVYDGPLVSAVVANGRYFGGGMKIAPNAGVSDGQLDVLILGDFTRAQLVSQIWKIYPGIHVNHPKVLSVRGRSVRIDPQGPGKLDLDGELYGGGPYEFLVLKSALSVVA